eukprot:2791871-Rhodomonas_salina.1
MEEQGTQPQVRPVQGSAGARVPRTQTVIVAVRAGLRLREARGPKRTARFDRMVLSVEDDVGAVHRVRREGQSDAAAHIASHRAIDLSESGTGRFPGTDQHYSLHDRYYWTCYPTTQTRQLHAPSTAVLLNAIRLRMSGTKSSAHTAYWLTSNTRNHIPDT